MQSFTSLPPSSAASSVAASSPDGILDRPSAFPFLGPLRCVTTSHFTFFLNLLVMLKRFKHFLKIIIFIAYIHQNLVNVSNYKDNNFQDMLESFKHLNEKFHGEMRSGLKSNGCNDRLQRVSLELLSFNLSIHSSAR